MTDPSDGIESCDKALYDAMTKFLDAAQPGMPDAAPTDTQPTKPHGRVGVGMPHLLRLEAFGLYVYDAFGVLPCLVGSALTHKQWRDVDVRLILSSKQWVELFGLTLLDPADFALKECDDTIEDITAQKHWNRGTHYCPKWVALCLAWSALGKEMTGLPIDFQIQPQYVAKLLHPQDECPRYRLGGPGVVARDARVANGNPPPAQEGLRDVYGDRLVTASL